MSARGGVTIAQHARLAKTALSDVEFRVFTRGLRIEHRNGKDAYYVPFRICMTQLALLCADRDRARELRRWIPGQDRRAMAGLAGRKHAAIADLFRMALTPKHDHSAGLAPISFDELEFAEFKRWLERTRRYSFYL